MNQSNTEETKGEKGTGISKSLIFIREVAKYFMDFLEQPISTLQSRFTAPIKFLQQ
jgi:hypothetical protein